MADPEPDSIGAEVRRTRLALGLSQLELAKAIGRNRATISRIERNEFEEPRSLGAVLAFLGLGEYAEATAAGRARELPDHVLAAELVSRLGLLADLREKALSEGRPQERSPSGEQGDLGSMPPEDTEEDQPTRRDGLTSAG